MRDKHRISERLYAALLHLYPKEFRATYGQQMRLTFRDACRVAYSRNGVRGLLALWLPTLLDLFKSALEERAQQGEIIMSKTKLIALAGPLTILVGSMWLVMIIGDLVRLTGLSSSEGFWDPFLSFLSLSFFLSLIPMLFAVMGTRLRFHQTVGILGKLGLGLSVAGCVGVILSVLANPLLGGGVPDGGQHSWMSYVAVVCFLNIRIGYILFGLDALRYRPLSRWNLLPLLLGLTVVLSLPFDWFGAPAFLSSQWATPFLHFAITGTCWVLLGIAMIDQSREPQPTAAI